MHRIWLAIALLASFLASNVKGLIWEGMSKQEQSEANLSLKASIAEMTPEEFQLISSVVEAESDRNPEHTEGKKLIALTILNRVDSPDFPDTITGVITEAGQFTVYYEGIYKQTGRTEESDVAVVDAVLWSKQEHPNVIYFNSIGFSSWAEPYAYVEGNYFSLGG